MKIGAPKDATRILGRNQGYQALPVSDVVTEQGVPCMCSVWHPTREELHELSAGGHIKLMVAGTEHPPVKLFVSDADGRPVDEGVLS